MIFSHLSPEYTNRKPNGALLYSEEIVKFFIPNIKTDRNWVTINLAGHAFDHSIVFIHNNLTPELYEWLAEFNDLILVCSQPETMEKVKQWGYTIYVPLSIPVKEVEKYRVEKKTKVKAYAGRAGKYASRNARNCDRLEDMPHEELLKAMADYQFIYAVGRTALEAKVLGCRILRYDPRFPDTSRWQVIDSMEAVKILQEELDRAEREIMGGTKAGARKTAITNKLKHGEDFYKRIGAMGGKKGGMKGFALNPELAKIAGAKGGKISKRGKAKKNKREELDVLKNLSETKIKTNYIVGDEE